MRIPIAICSAALIFAGCDKPADSSGQMPDPADDTKLLADGTAPIPTNMERPEGWIVRLDRPDPTVTIGTSEDNDVYFVNMEPGWHITTHKAAIFYHPEKKAEGTFSAKASIFLFDPGDRNREAFGMFVGGKDLASDNQEYLYFLLRNEGDYLIKRRSGNESNVVVDWTPTDAMVVHPHDSTDSVLNQLEIRAGVETVSFLVNGSEVANLARSEAKVDGIVGLRLNHGLNVHISEVSVGM